MSTSPIRRYLEDLREGRRSVDEVMRALRDLPYQDLGFARIDHHRPLRTGSPEVVLGRGKTPQQVAEIVQALAGRGHPALVTKTDAETYARVVEVVPAAAFNELAQAIVAPGPEPGTQHDGILVVTAGTADLPISEEAALTAELMGNRVARLNDVGVAGLHRLLDALPTLQEARVIVAVAGMEAALVSVVAGLVSAPVVAVPTSVGYGASFGGVAALLGMLNSCAPGVSVVNIDNGFGAGYLAARLNLLAQGKHE